MATYLVGHIRIKNAILWQQYVDGVRESLQPFAAEVVFRGAKTGDLAGEQIMNVKMDHIVINTVDINLSLHFYIKILELHGERIEEFKHNQVPFPSVRITKDTIIDLFPGDQGPLSCSNAERVAVIVAPNPVSRRRPPPLAFRRPMFIIPLEKTTTYNNTNRIRRGVNDKTV